MYRNEITDARELERKIDAVLNEACVQLLIVTSPPSAVSRATYDAQCSVPAYDAVEGVEYDPRAFRALCASCGRSFVVHRRHARYCGDTCRTAANRARRAA